MWDDLLRVAASVKGGHATTALVVGKLCSSKRQQNALASAIKEYGAVRRTVYAARYLADEAYRRRIGRQLNKGKNLHALKRSLAYANEGALRRRHYEQQAGQMWCLTLAANAVVTWTSEYNSLAVTALRHAGRDIDDAVLAHIWPTHHENVHFYGTHSVDVELAQLEPTGTGRCAALRAGTGEQCCRPGRFRCEAGPLTMPARRIRNNFWVPGRIETGLNAKPPEAAVAVRWQGLALAGRCRCRRGRGHGGRRGRTGPRAPGSRSRRPGPDPAGWRPLPAR